MIKNYKHAFDGYVVEAVQFAGNFGEIEGFVGGDAGEHSKGGYVVATMEGGLRFIDRDYIVKDREGKFRAVCPEYVKTFLEEF